MSNNVDVISENKKLYYANTCLAKEDLWDLEKIISRLYRATDQDLRVCAEEYTTIITQLMQNKIIVNPRYIRHSVLQKALRERLEPGDWELYYAEYENWLTHSSCDSDGTVSIFDYGEYEDNPLYFMKLSLSNEVTLNLMDLFHQWYGDTDQDTEEYALECHLVDRHLLYGEVIINPMYLYLIDVVGQLQRFLTEQQWMLYQEEFAKRNTV